MKKLFLSLALLTIAAMSYAQSSVLATLSHEGEISTFYGARALKEAHAAAEHGDVITLSSGSFQATDITKAVTIRGAGMQVDSIAQIYPSVVVGGFKIDVPDSLEQHLTVEGIYCDNNTVNVCHTLSNATFIKSRFYTVRSMHQTNNYGYMKNLAFIHCKIQSYFYNTNGSNSISFVNSLIMNPSVGYNSYSSNSFEFTNCVVRWTEVYYPFQSYYAIFRNCILSSSSTSDSNNRLSSTLYTTALASLQLTCLRISQHRAAACSTQQKTWQTCSRHGLGEFLKSRLMS